MALSIKTYGTNKATSASGLPSVIDAEISLANVNASSFVCGLSFQLPEMKGLRAYKVLELLKEDWCCTVGANAAAEPARMEAIASFMVVCCSGRVAALGDK